MISIGLIPLLLYKTDFFLKSRQSWIPISLSLAATLYFFLLKDPYLTLPIDDPANITVLGTLGLVLVNLLKDKVSKLVSLFPLILYSLTLSIYSYNFIDIYQAVFVFWLIKLFEGLQKTRGYILSYSMIPILFLMFRMLDLYGVNLTKVSGTSGLFSTNLLLVDVAIVLLILTSIVLVSITAHYLKRIEGQDNIEDQWNLIVWLGLIAILKSEHQGLATTFEMTMIILALYSAFKLFFGKASFWACAFPLIFINNSFYPLFVLLNILLIGKGSPDFFKSLIQLIKREYVSLVVILAVVPTMMTNTFSMNEKLGVSLILLMSLISFLKNMSLESRC